MGADLFESYTGSILAPTILAATFALAVISPRATGFGLS
ncbi:MAG: hypothetical protein ACLT98_12290 [Eggerthellaceae bacterium]